METGPACEECGKTESLVSCFYPPQGPEEQEEPDHLYCGDHAGENGFCRVCGWFWAGVEAFDFAEAFGRPQGVCPNCYADELDDEDENHEDDDGEDW